jgi:hypothetical protein
LPASLRALNVGIVALLLDVMTAAVVSRVIPRVLTARSA